MKPICYQMAQKAKDWRFVRACTRVELADKSGMIKQKIVKYEQGKISFKKVPEMAEGLSVHTWVLLPTSREEIYCKDEGENKILSIMKEYQKIDNQRLKDAISTFVAKIVKISESN